MDSREQTFRQIQEGERPAQNLIEVDFDNVSSIDKMEDVLDSDYKYDKQWHHTYIKFEPEGEEKTTGKFKHLEPGISMAQNPDEVPEKKMAGVAETMWRVDTLKKLTYTQFWILVRENQVEKVRFGADRRSILVTTKETAPGGKRTEKVGVPWDPQLYPYMLEHGVFIEQDEVYPLEQQMRTYVRWFGPFIFAMIFFNVVFWVKDAKDLFERDTFGAFEMKPVRPKDIGVGFKDVAGIDQIKDEIKELVTFLKSPGAFTELGALAPKGVLLCGPPGTGKTLLAKALSSESGVPFFTLSGSEFQDPYVGQGAKAVREIFYQARKEAPCIIFIDEFDGLAGKRSQGVQDDDEDTVSTLNQFLQEMDGFESNIGVVILAATNRPSVLDPAVVRPGRFDKVIQMPLPNLEQRISILRVHCEGKIMDPKIDMEVIGRLTAGFTGAELMNVINQGAIVAGRKEESQITEDNIIEALEEVQNQRLGMTQLQDFETGQTPPYLRRSFALYEAGRAIIAHMHEGFDEVRKVVICPNGRPRSFTQFVPLESMLETGIQTKKYMQIKLIVTMAGRCAERMVLGDAFLGSRSVNDQNDAFLLATQMVSRYGFSELGPMATGLLPPKGDHIVKDQEVQARDGVSEEFQERVKEQVVLALEQAEAAAYEGLSLNYKFFGELAQHLEEAGSVNQAEFLTLVDDPKFVMMRDTQPNDQE